jgi:hypothetical protein
MDLSLLNAKFTIMMKLHFELMQIISRLLMFVQTAITVINMHQLLECMQISRRNHQMEKLKIDDEHYGNIRFNAAMN